MSCWDPSRLDDRESLFTARQTRWVRSDHLPTLVEGRTYDRRHEPVFRVSLTTTEDDEDFTPHPRCGDTH